jgi:hypothetical protein
MNSQLENIKRKLGTDCTHISYVQTKVKDAEGIWQNVDAIKAVLVNNVGGKNKVEIVLPVKFGELKDSNFDEVYNYIKDKKYVG